MKKQKISFILIIALLFMSMSTAFAAGDETITFRGEAQKFVSNVQKDSEGFTNMLPGEERTVSLTLINEDSAEMSFYMSAEIIDNIASKTADSQAVYDFVISKNKVPFFQTVIGGGSTQNNSIGTEYLDKNNNILLDTLAKGQSDVIDITLKLDGSSTGNTYMNQSGEIELVFTATTPNTNNQPGGGNIVDQIINTVTQAFGGKGNVGPNTGLGGNSNYLIIAGVCILIAILAIVALIVSRRKKERD